MQYQKRNLLTIALASALALAFASGCDDDKKSGTNGTDGSGTGGSGKDVKVHEWKKLAKGAKFNPTGNGIERIMPSGDGQWLYAVTAANELYIADLTGGLKDIHDDGKWGKVDFAATGLGAGDAKIADVTPHFTTIERLDATQDGVMVSAKHTTAGTTAGLAALLKGKTFRATWAPLNGAATHIGVQGVATGTTLYAGVLKRTNGKELPYVQYFLNAAGNFNVNQNRTLNVTLDTAADAVVAALGVGYAGATAFVYADGPHFFVSSGTGADTKAMIVTKVGIRKYAADAELGSNTGAADTANGLVAKWQVTGGAAGNNDISSVASLGDYVYVGLKSTGADNKGGVFVFNAKTDASAVTVPAEWKSVSVVDLAVDKKNNVVYAVTSKELVLVGTDGSKGKVFATTPVPALAQIPQTATAAYDKGEALPIANITGAKVIDGNLLIATSDKGLLVQGPAVTEKVTK